MQQVFESALKKILGFCFFCEWHHKWGSLLAHFTWLWAQSARLYYFTKVFTRN